MTGFLRWQFHVEVGITSASASRVDERAAERILHEQLLQLKIGQRQVRVC
jgi:hypothetical protein